MRTCIVDVAAGLVVNVVELGTQADSATISENAAAPAGLMFIPSDSAGIGWRLVNGSLVAPPADPPPVDPLASGYSDPATGVVLPLDATSQLQITAQGLRAFGDLQSDPTTAAGKSYLFPTRDGKGAMIAGAAASYDLANRCGAYVEGLRKAALGIA